MKKINLYVSGNGFYIKNKDHNLEWICDIKNLIEKIKKKSIDIIILEENIFIETIITKERNVENVVSKYVRQKFGDRDDILYNYIVSSKNGSYSITIYLINTSCLDQLKDFMALFKINSVWPIQIRLCEKLKRKYKDFHVFVEEKETIYFINVKNRILVGTGLVDSISIKDMIKELPLTEGKNAFVYGKNNLKDLLVDMNKYNKVVKLGENLYEV